MKIRFMVKVFPSGSFYAEKAVNCLERHGFNRKDFQVKLDFPLIGDASLFSRTDEIDRMAWEEARVCLKDPKDEPLPPMEGKMAKKRKLSGLTSDDISDVLYSAESTCLKLLQPDRRGCEKGVRLVRERLYMKSSTLAGRKRKR
ncbi:MAG: hypothetical protein ACRD1Z_08580 [Vicinamibacteria bacterium]